MLADVAVRVAWLSPSRRRCSRSPWTLRSPPQPLTVTFTSIPASLCPGTEQKNS
jgi:hypothetical protein